LELIFKKVNLYANITKQSLSSTFSLFANTSLSPVHVIQTKFCLIVRMNP